MQIQNVKKNQNLGPNVVEISQSQLNALNIHCQQSQQLVHNMMPEPLSGQPMTSTNSIQKSAQSPAQPPNYDLHYALQILNNNQQVTNQILSEILQNQKQQKHLEKKQPDQEKVINLSIGADPIINQTIGQQSLKKPQPKKQ